MRLILTVVMALVCATAHAADVASIRSFFGSILGGWDGVGSVQIQGLGSNSGTYPIQVHFETLESGVDVWSVTTSITGMPGRPTQSTTTYQIVGDALQISTSQYSVFAEVQTSSQNQLAFYSNRIDPMTQKSVMTARNLLVQPDGHLQFFSDIYQNNSLVQHFDYVLSRSQSL